MSKLRLQIKRPGRTDTHIPVIVNSTDRVGNFIPSLVEHLGLPRHDGRGSMLIYSLRRLSGGQSLSKAMRFADAQLLPETRLVLELDEANRVPQPVGTSISRSGMAVSARSMSPLNPLQIVNRRTFMVGSVLTGCALSGLFTGVATAFATQQRTLLTTMAPATTSSSQMPGKLQQTLLFSSHQQTVRSVAWSPDGTTVASGADDGFLLLWTSDGQVQQQISHPTGVAAVAWSPAGKLLASGSGNSVRFFDAHTAVQLAPARNVHTAQVTSLAWSPALGHPLVSGSRDRQAIVWETHDFQPQAIFTRHTTAISALSCQPGNTTVASASQGGVVRVWQVDTLQELHGFYQDAQLPMYAVAFAPIGNQLAVGGNDGLIRLWSDGLVCQQSTGTTQGLLCVDMPVRFHIPSSPVRSVSWSPDGRYIATGGQGGIFAIWAYTPGRIPTLVTSTTYGEPVVAVAWSPVHKQIAVASGKAVSIWNIEM